MRPALGFTSISAPDLISIIRSIKPRSKIFVSGISHESELAAAKFAVFTSVNALQKFYSIVYKTDAVVVVSDCIMNLKRVKNLNIVDGGCTANFRTEFLSVPVQDIILGLTNTSEGKPLKFRKLDIASDILKNTPESVMSNVMTFLFKIPNKDRREYARAAIYEWLCTPAMPFSSFLEKLSFRGASGKAFKNYLQSPSVDALRSMFSPNADLEKILKENNLSVFDYNYILKWKTTKK